MVVAGQLSQKSTQLLNQGGPGSTQPEKFYRNPGQVVPESTRPLYKIPSLVGVSVRLIVRYVISNGSSIKF